MIDIDNFVDEYDEKIDIEEYEEIFPEEQSYNLWMQALEADFIKEAQSQENVA
jgi:hypothetical protein